jgi:carbon-monoxide dehydrogenase medium subunit
MKPAPFTYATAESVEDAVRLLGEDEDARILAGGQSLVPMLNLRLAVPTTLIDIGGVAELKTVDVDAEWVTFGAMVRQSHVLADRRVAEACPVVPVALQHVGHPQTRSRGTIGGTIAHADPAGELVAALVAVDGEVDVVGPSGKRRIGADALFLSYYTTSLEPDEIITAVRFPVLRGAGAGCVEISRRRRDFALVGAVAQLTRTEQGTIADARVAVFAFADRPMRVAQVEEALRGREADARVIAEAAATWSPIARGERAYATRVAPVIVRRALAQALQRAS